MVNYDITGERGRMGTWPWTLICAGNSGHTGFCLSLSGFWLPVRMRCGLWETQLRAPGVNTDVVCTTVT